MPPRRYGATLERGAVTSRVASFVRRAASALRKGAFELAVALVPRLVLVFTRPTGGALGLVGEELAARSLAAEGWSIVGRRIATPAGEIDIVARAGEVLAAVEVKAGRARQMPDENGDVPPGRWRPADRVDARRIARQSHAARWLAACAGAPEARVDVVEVWVVGLRTRVVHHTNVEAPLGDAPLG